MKRVLQVIFLSLVLAALAQGLWQQAHLPERVASHFDGTGRANGWMTRSAFLAWQAGTLLFLAALFESIVLLQTRLPREYVNLPHRDYWLAPERRAATDAWVGSLVLAIGCLVMTFFIALFHQVYRINLEGDPRLLAGVRPLTTLLGLASVTVIALILLRFARKPAA
jgi:uncharacterized membrane protein